jgi:hypothetical protein
MIKVHVHSRPWMNDHQPTLEFYINRQRVIINIFNNIKSKQLRFYWTPESETCSKWRRLSDGMLRPVFWYILTPMMEAVNSPETSVNIYQITRRNIREDSIFILVTVRTWNLTVFRINLNDRMCGSSHFLTKYYSNKLMGQKLLKGTWLSLLFLLQMFLVRRLAARKLEHIPALSSIGSGKMYLSDGGNFWLRIK